MAILDIANFVRDKYVADGNGFFKVDGAPFSGVVGTATTTFTGEPGLYTFALKYADEADGAGKITVKVDGKVVSEILLDQNLTPGDPGVKNNEIAKGVALNTNSVITIEGLQDRGAYARVDFFEITKTGELPPPSIGPTVTITSLITSDSTPDLSGTVSDDNDSAAKVEVSLNGKTYTAQNKGDGTWFLSGDLISPLAVGSYEVGVTATDKDGNKGTDRSSVELTINPAPSIPFAPPSPTIKLGTALPEIEFNFNKNRGERLVGDNSNNVERGGKKNDILRGKGGKDKGFGAGGNDRVSGDAGKDVVNGGGGNDLLKGGSGDDTLIGGGGRDLLNGGAGADTLNGGNGDDILVGGIGADTLTGGGGRDMYRFNALSEGIDTIKDFDVANDLLDLRTLFAGAQFGTADAVTKFTQFVGVVQVGTDTQVLIDPDGTGANNTFTNLVTLSNVQATTVTPANFVIA